MSDRPRSAVIALASVLGWAALLWVLGLDVGHALILAAALVALIGLRRSPAVNSDQDWPSDDTTRSDTGVRREVARLSWSMQGYESRVQRQSVRRLHQIALYRLGERGLDLEDPRDYLACQAALGERAYHVVSEPEERPLYADFVAAVSAVEKLGNGSAATVGSDGVRRGKGNSG
ncbi:MAG TPA: hypothetical protein VFU98_08920 [Microlunatus sp.]|nr:hypothetical protein [Microlunatus sp.]